jgi:uncharacterized membrane protein
METIDALAVALGLATLAGLNLYLTVLVAGVAIRLEWVTLGGQHTQLAVLGDPWVIGVASLLYVLGFFADKVPWVDSLNDMVHTAIRPVGGAILGVLALGDANPVVSVIAALLCGGAAFTTHAAKASTRLVANTSPEPVSNIGLSLGEDAVVLGGLTLVALHPLIAGILALAAVILAWILLPKLFRATRATLWLAWKKLNAPVTPEEPGSGRLPARLDLALRRARSSETSIGDIARCISAGGTRLPSNHIGWLVRLDDGAVFFVSPRLFDALCVEIPHGSSARSSRFLGEALEVLPASGSPYRFQFERAAAKAADRFAKHLRTPQILVAA